MGIRNFDNCTREQHEQLLNWFFYRLKPEQRTALHADLPRAYDAFIGNTEQAVTERHRVVTAAQSFGKPPKDHL